jgi:hypothetical protein
MENWRLKMEYRYLRVYGPVVADYQHIEEELDPDPAIRIRIRTKVMRIRNSDSYFQPASNILL